MWQNIRHPNNAFPITTTPTTTTPIMNFAHWHHLIITANQNLNSHKGNFYTSLVAIAPFFMFWFVFSRLKAYQLSWFI